MGAGWDRAARLVASFNQASLPAGTDLGPQQAEQTWGHGARHGGYPIFCGRPSDWNEELKPLKSRCNPRSDPVCRRSNLATPGDGAATNNRSGQWHRPAPGVSSWSSAPAAPFSTAAPGYAGHGPGRPGGTAGEDGGFFSGPLVVPAESGFLTCHFIVRDHDTPSIALPRLRRAITGAGAWTISLSQAGCVRHALQQLSAGGNWLFSSSHRA